MVNGIVTRLRRVIGPLAAVWLCSRLTAIVLAPVALSAMTVDASAPACTCAHDVNGACPMHQKSHSTQSTSGVKVCVMQSANDLAAAVLQALFGAAGVTPDSVIGVSLVEPATFAKLQSSLIIARPVPPDPPPPRV